MPCMDYGRESGAVADLSKRNDELARYACIFATAFENLCEVRRIPEEEQQELLEKVSKLHTPAAMRWWKQHKKDDAAATARKHRADDLLRKGQSLLAKITKEQKEALEAAGVMLPDTKKKVLQHKRKVPKG